jgi:hypothetical protein
MLANPWDPPLLRQGWLTARRLSRSELLVELRARLRDAGWSSERIGSLLWHGGVHLAGHPFAEEALPSEVAAGTPVVAYAFAYEPARVPVSEQAILLDAFGVLAVNKPAWITGAGHAGESAPLARGDVARAAELQGAHCGSSPRPPDERRRAVCAQSRERRAPRPRARERASQKALSRAGVAPAAGAQLGGEWISCPGASSEEVPFRALRRPAKVAGRAAPVLSGSGRARARRWCWPSP